VAAGACPCEGGVAAQRGERVQDLVGGLIERFLEARQLSGNEPAEADVYSFS
jgi:hypothetical protein